MMNDDTQANGSALEQPQAPTPAQGRAARSNRGKKAVAELDTRLVCITLHANDQIPPGGQFIGCNGNGIYVPSSRKVWVPRWAVNVLNDAVKGEVDKNDKLQVVGYREVPRLAYTLHLDEKLPDELKGKVA